MSTTLTAPWTLTVTIDLPDATVTDILVGGYSIRNGVSHTLPADNAHATIGAIDVVMSDGSAYGGTITVSNQDGGWCPFATTDSHLPCDLVVGEESVAASAYALQFSLAG